MAVMNDKWRQSSENRKHNPSKITGGKGREETVNKGTPAFLGQSHRAASGLSRRRSCYSLRIPGGHRELWAGRGRPKLGELWSVPCWFCCLFCLCFLFKRRFRTCLDYSVSFGCDVIYIDTLFIGCRDPQFSLAVRSEHCFCIVIQSFESRRDGGEVTALAVSAYWESHLEQ